MTVQVKGHCPWCGHDGLFVGAGGHLTCPSVTCDRPTATDELLDDRETQHVVTFTRNEFTIRHPLNERLDDRLMECDLHAHLMRMTYPPVQPGRYRVHRQDEDPVEPWFYEELWLAEKGKRTRRDQ